MFPVILKPFSAEEIDSVGFKVHIVQTFQNLTALAKDVLENAPFVLQEYIPGGDDKSWFYIFYTKGDCMIECMGNKILQHPSEKGIMAIGRTVYNARLSEICHSFIKSLGYEGIGGIEFKEYNGIFYFIEMSTRPEGFIKITNHLSPSMLVQIYNALSGMPLGDINKCKENACYIDWLLFLLEIKKKFGRISLFFKYKLFIGATVNLWDLKDPKPFFLHLKKLLSPNSK